MQSNVQSFQTPQFALLSDNQKERIHFATLEVLRRTGVRVFCQEAIDLLRHAGCSVDEGNLVRMPAHLVEQAIRMAPSSVLLHDRNGEPAMRLEGTHVHYGTGSDLPTVIDPYDGQRRTSMKKDVANVATLCDALPNIDFVMSMALPSDVPVKASDVHSFEAMITHTTKPIVYTAHEVAGLQDIVEMAGAVAGGADALRQKPSLVLYAEPSTPLQHSKEAVEKLLWIAEQKLPVAYVPGSVSGAASPVTKAGTIVCTNAELLSGLVMAQLKQPGTACIFGSGTGPLDMRTMVAVYAAPEFMLMTSALAELGRYYRLPTWGFAGCGDAKVFDQQAAMEGGFWSLMAGLSGANLCHDVGYIESGMTCSFEMLASMDEGIGLVKSIMQGIALDDDQLAVDVIDQVGPGGDYLATEHTGRHYRELWGASLFDRRNYSEWAERGKKTLGERAGDKVRHILETHQAPPLSPAATERIAEIVRRADAR